VTRRRKVLIAIATGLLLVAGYFLSSLVYTWRHIPEAYAAWDTGALLVEYMHQNDGRWPSGWDDLLSVIEGEKGQAKTLLYRSMVGRSEYGRSLQRMVAVDWSFAPDDVGPDARPVTRRDGTAFPVVWGGCEPNDIVRRYLQNRDRQRPRQAR
jgi:hypothetical protein